MRKFLLILLNVLCLNIANGQERRLVSITDYNENSIINNTGSTQISIYFSDKKTCLDTLYYNSRLTTTDGTQKYSIAYRLKHDDKKRLIENRINDTSFIRSSVTSQFEVRATSRAREYYIYTPARQVYDLE